MLAQAKADAAKLLFVNSVDAMLKRLEEIDERFAKDEEGRNHHTLREIQHWFRMTGQVNNRF
jgi:hypothetical protein